MSFYREKQIASSSVRVIASGNGGSRFPGGRPPERRGPKPIILAKFSQKLHTNEKKNGRGGVSRPSPFDPPMTGYCRQKSLSPIELQKESIPVGCVPTAP